jgi:Fe-S-cluster containining protein
LFSSAVPIFYECDRCTACCRWPGQVKLTDAELTQLATFLGLTEPDFIQRYTRLNAARNGLALLDQPDGACVFLDGGDCHVNPVKPQQCRDFPNLWNFPGFEQTCRAKPHDVPAEEWKRRVKLATGREVELDPV